MKIMKIDIKTINKFLEIDGKSLKALDVLANQSKEKLVMILTHIITILEIEERNYDSSNPNKE